MAPQVKESSKSIQTVLEQYTDPFPDIASDFIPE